MGFGVIAPDVGFSVMGPDIERDQIYDSTDRSAPFREYATSLASFWRKQDPRRRRGLNDSDIRCVADFLRGDFDLIPQMGTVLDDANAQLLTLTEEQFVVLEYAGGRGQGTHRRAGGIW